MMDIVSDACLPAYEEAIHDTFDAWEQLKSESDTTKEVFEKFDDFLRKISEAMEW
jgi:hypothetical protein